MEKCPLAIFKVNLFFSKNIGQEYCSKIFIKNSSSHTTKQPKFKYLKMNSPENNEVIMDKNDKDYLVSFFFYKNERNLGADVSKELKHQFSTCKDVIEECKKEIRKIEEKLIFSFDIKRREKQKLLDRMTLLNQLKAQMLNPPSEMNTKVFLTVHALFESDDKIQKTLSEFEDDFLRANSLVDVSKIAHKEIDKIRVSMEHSIALGKFSPVYKKLYQSQVKKISGLRYFIAKFEMNPQTVKNKKRKIIECS